MTAKQESNLLIIIMITDTIGWHEVLLPMNQNYEKIWKKLDIGCMFSLKKKTVNSEKYKTIECIWCYSVHLHRYDIWTVPLTVLLHCPITSMMCTLTY